MPSPAFAVLKRMTDQQVPPEPAQPEDTGEITIPDTLAASLANANKHLRQTIRSGAPIDDDSVAQMRVFASMIEALGQSEQPQNPTDMMGMMQQQQLPGLPGGPASPAAPGFPAVQAGSPGLPLPGGGT